jgi:hypothetical protein
VAYPTCSPFHHCLTPNHQQSSQEAIPFITPLTAVHLVAEGRFYHTHLVLQQGFMVGCSLQQGLYSVELQGQGLEGTSICLNPLEGLAEERTEVLLLKVKAVDLICIAFGVGCSFSSSRLFASMGK